jgi:hypothetical protein
MEPMRRLHHDGDMSTATDEARKNEARISLASSGSLQFVAELIEKLQSIGVPWWTPEQARDTWTALDRMTWLAQRPDLRQGLVTSLAGLPAKTARGKSPEYQAELLVSVMEAGDLSAARFDTAFSPADLVVYGPAAEFWQAFIDRMPWDDQSPVHEELIAWTLRSLLSTRSTMDGMSRAAIMSSWDVRANIDAHIWQEHMPIEIRAAIDEARLRQERTRPRDPYAARNELGIATPDVIAAHIPLRDLTTVFTAAGRALGFATTKSRSDALDDTTMDTSPPARRSLSDSPEIRSSGIVRRLVAA